MGREVGRGGKSGEGGRGEELAQFMASLEGGVDEGGVTATGFLEFALGIGIGRAAFEKLEESGGGGLFNEVVADRVIEDISAEGIKLLPDCVDIRRAFAQFLQEMFSSLGVFQAAVKLFSNIPPGGLQRLWGSRAISAETIPEGFEVEGVAAYGRKDILGGHDLCTGDPRAALGGINNASPGLGDIALHQAEIRIQIPDCGYLTSHCTGDPEQLLAAKNLIMVNGGVIDMIPVALNPSDSADERRAGVVGCAGVGVQGEVLAQEDNRIAAPITGQIKSRLGDHAAFDDRTFGTEHLVQPGEELRFVGGVSQSFIAESLGDGETFGIESQTHTEIDIGLFSVMAEIEFGRIDRDRQVRWDADLKEIIKNGVHADDEGMFAEFTEMIYVFLERRSSGDNDGRDIAQGGPSSANAATLSERGEIAEQVQDILLTIAMLADQAAFAEPPDITDPVFLLLHPFGKQVACRRMLDDGDPIGEDARQVGHEGLISQCRRFSHEETAGRQLQNGSQIDLPAGCPKHGNGRFHKEQEIRRMFASFEKKQGDISEAETQNGEVPCAGSILNGGNHFAGVGERLLWMMQKKCLAVPQNAHARNILGSRAENDGFILSAGAEGLSQVRVEAADGGEVMIEEICHVSAVETIGE